LSYVPADAAVVAFANVREVMDSQLRQRLKLVLPQEQGQKEFQAETGIDIEHDIDYVVAAMTTSDAGVSDPNGLVVARGRFNTTQLESLAREHGGVVEEYQGKHLIKASAPHEGATGDHSKTVILAFLEPGLVAIGSERAIKSSIDAQLSAHSISSNNEMMELIADIDQGNNAWAVGRFDAIANQARMPPEIASRMPAVKTFAVMTHIDGGVSGSLRAETKDDASADNLRQVVQGMLALGRMSGDPKATALLNSLQLSGTGKTVRLSFSVPSEVLDMIPLKAMHDAHHPDLIAPKPPTPER
jgi:hypothetical protein